MSRTRQFAKRCATAGLAVVVAFALGACGSGSTGAADAARSGSQSQATADSGLTGGVQISGDQYPLSITDFVGHAITLDHKPERVCVISGTPLNIWYDIGGTAVCGPSVSENTRLVAEHAAEISSLPEVGQTYAVNIEALVAQQPDLVVSMVGPQDSQLPRIREVGLQTVSVKVRTFDELATTYRLFGSIIGSTDLAEQRIAEIAARRDAVLAQWPGGDIPVVILYVTAQALSVKLDNSIAGSMSQTLGLTNIASGLMPDNPGSETTPLSIEEIVRQQPDYVLVTSMISTNELARDTLDAEFARNQAWQAVDAVREGRVIYLPQQYFLYNAGPYYAEALEYLAASLRPDIFGEPVLTE